MNRQLFEYHPAFGFRFIPNLKARVEHEAGGYLVRSNKSGFRCERFNNHNLNYLASLIPKLMKFA